jgi:hypothetical protein
MSALSAYPLLSSVVMAKTKAETTRAQTYRLPVQVLERIDAFVEAFERTHEYKTTATDFVTKSLIEALEKKEPTVGIKPPRR